MTPRTTVCQLLHSLNVGGAELLAARMGRHFRETHDVVFACLDELGDLGQTLRDEGFEVEVLNRRPGLDIRCARRLAAFLKRHHVDIIHAHQYTPFFYGLLARRFERRPSILFTEHGRTFPDYPRPKRMLVNRLLLERRDRVVAVGQAVRQALIQNEGIPAARIDVIYNGIELARFEVDPSVRTRVRHELGFRDEDLLLVQVARLDPLKDHRTAVRAMSKVVAELPTAHLLIVGEGPEEGMIREEIKALNLANHIHLLGLRHDIPALFAASDLGLLTSVSEGIPLAIIEAMAAGLAVVSTNVGGVSEVVLDGKTGRLAPSGDTQSLATAIIESFTNSENRSSYAVQGNRRACERFSETQMLDEYRTQFNAVSSNRKNVAPRVLSGATD